MAKHAGRILLTIIVFYVAAFTGLCLYYSFTFPEKFILPHFRLTWIINTVCILFSGYMLPLYLTAVLLSYSKAEGQERKPYYKTVSSALILSLFFAAFFMFCREIVVPPKKAQNETFRRSTIIARGYLEKAKELEQGGKKHEAAEFLKQYLLIDPDEGILDRLKAIDAKIVIEKREPKKEDSTPGPDQATEFVKKAQGFLKERDYYSAHYYALKASALDRERTDAQRIASEAWEGILSQEPSPSEKELSAVYRRKREGYLELTRNNPVRAYYIFKELSERVPADLEVKKYLEESARDLSAQSFFIDEAEEALLYPVGEDILFINPLENGQKEFIFIKTLAENAGEYYAAHLEALTLSPEGKIIQLMTAPYARLSGTTVYLNCLHRDDPSKNPAPVYQVKEAIPEQKTVKNIQIRAKDLKLFSMDPDTLSRADINELFSLRGEFKKSGLPSSMLYGELFERLAAVSAFIILSLFSVSAGWALRLKRGKTPFTIIFVIPAYILITKEIFAAFLSIQKELYAYLLSATSVTTSFIAVLIVQAVFLAAAFLSLTGQSARS
jgi:hypothetical protein